MAGPARLNIIWFRDDQPARRLRLRPGWLRLASYFLVVVTLLAAGGVFASYHLWRRSQILQREHGEAEASLHDAQAKLERLQNIEKLLKNTDPTELPQILASLGVTPAKDAKETPKPAGERGDKPAGFDLSDILGRIDLGQLKVENFRAKVDQKTVAYAFDLANLTPQPLAGNGQLLALTRSGDQIPVQTGKDELGFNIQRSKQFSAQAHLPPGIDPGNLFGFRLVLSNATGKTIFGDTYPLAKDR